MYSEEEVKELIKCAADPATDRTFLALKFTEAILNRRENFSVEGLVTTAFRLADEFIKQSSLNK